MYGVKDSKGVELEPGDSVRILIELWPDADPGRKGSLAKVDSLIPPDVINVCFDLDAQYDWYYDDEIELVEP